MSRVAAVFADVLLGLLGLAMIAAFVRLARGPRLTDRVVALDLMTMIAMAMSAVYATVHDAPVFLDVAILVALIAFVGTIAFAHYIERRWSKPDDR
ncbi:MAG: monovalent cation/H+ antiporter complex subunit F [Acidobacteriota bacterium]|nr:monovalent cation/H+ antiporter complex subunit F [Acidobacteriota bacterium]